jgi:hypothetical protein
MQCSTCGKEIELQSAHHYLSACHCDECYENANTERQLLDGELEHQLEINEGLTKEISRLNDIVNYYERRNDGPK